MVRTQVKKRPRVKYRHTTRAIHNGLDLQHRLEHIRNSLGEIKGNITDKASDVVASSIKRAKKQSKRVGRYVHNKPYRSIGIALVTAVCLGLLFRNR